MERDLGEEEPRVDAHQLPVPVVQMALPETRGETWRIPSDAAGSGRARVYRRPCASSTALTLLPFTTRVTITTGYFRRRFALPMPTIFFSTHLQTPWKAQTSTSPHSPTGPPSLGCCCGTAGSPGGPGDKISRDGARWGWHGAGQAPTCPEAGKDMDPAPCAVLALGVDV